MKKLSRKQLKKLILLEIRNISEAQAGGESAAMAAINKVEDENAKEALTILAEYIFNVLDKDKGDKVVPGES